MLRARCAAAAGDIDGALAAVSAAVERGFREVRRLGEVPEFAEVVRHPQFEPLVAAATRNASPAGPAR
jgi:hypothetical protein